MFSKNFIRETCSGFQTFLDRISVVNKKFTTYVFIYRIISKCKLDLKDIGNKDFIQKISEFVEKCDINELTENFNIPKERVSIYFRIV